MKIDFDRSKFDVVSMEGCVAVWLQSPPYVDAEVPTLDVLEQSYESRIEFATWAHAWFTVINAVSRFPTQPCSWCGHPTGDFCEACPRDKKYGPSHALCTFCEKTIRECRLCRLTTQLEHERLRSVHVQQDSVWLGNSECAACGKKAAKLQLCSRCCCVRYCCKLCQDGHWKAHKRLCTLLRQQQPLVSIYGARLSLAVEVTRDHPQLLPSARSQWPEALANKSMLQSIENRISDLGTDGVMQAGLDAVKKMTTDCRVKPSIMNSYLRKLRNDSAASCTDAVRPNVLKDMLVLVLRDDVISKFEISIVVPLENMMSAYCSQHEVDSNCVDFMLERYGKLSPADTLERCGLDPAQIMVTVRVQAHNPSGVASASTEAAWAKKSPDLPPVFVCDTEWPSGRVRPTNQHEADEIRRIFRMSDDEYLEYLGQLTGQTTPARCDLPPASSQGKLSRKVKQRARRTNHA